MKDRLVGSFAIVVLALGSSTTAVAQNAVKLFGSTFVRPSQVGTRAAMPVTFNSATVSLSCGGDGALSAVLSSTPDGRGNVLVDNVIRVSVDTGSGAAANVCRGGARDATSGGLLQNCFNATYRAAATSMVGTDLDTYTLQGGVPAIDISSLLAAGDQKLTIDVADIGSVLGNASLYLVTSCSQGGVTGPAKISGNPISKNPTPEQLDQDFDFNSTPGQLVGFGYDLTQSQQDGALTIVNNTIPTVTDAPLDPALWQSQYATGTSFATSSCMVHKGEILNGSPACKLFTLTCQIGTGAQAAGALCPRSALRDQVFTDSFTGPGFDLPDIVGANGKTFHQGVGFLMAGEGWTGGPCSFDPLSGLQDEGCPQNLLTNLAMRPAGSVETTAKATSRIRLLFAAPDFDSDFDGTGTHPNSTFISVAQVPEDLTTVTVTGAHAGGWVNSRTIKFGLVSEPPVLTSSVTNYQNFVASPIKSITYGISDAGQVPGTKFPVPGDVTLTNSTGCPKPAPPAGVYAPPSQMLTVATDGAYALHYFAQDCAGTEELKYTGDINSGWTASFFTVPINVDTVVPKVASGPTFSVAPSTINGTPNAFKLNQAVNVSYRCTDDRAGVAVCGKRSYSSPGTLDTSTLTYALDTSSVGAKTLTIPVEDAAGNSGTTVTFNYNVVATGNADVAVATIAKARVQTGGTIAYDSLILNLGPSTANNIVFTNVLPAGTTFVSAGLESLWCGLNGGCTTPPSNACTASGSTVTCKAGSLNALSWNSITGIGVQVVVKVTAAKGARLMDKTTVTSANPDPTRGNNTATWQTVVY